MERKTDITDERKEIVSYRKEQNFSILSFLIILFIFLVYDLMTTGVDFNSTLDNVFRAMGISILIFFAGSSIKNRREYRLNNVPVRQRALTYISIYILVSVFIAGVYAIVVSDWLSVFNCGLILAVLFYVHHIELHYDIYLPLSFKFIILIFLYMSLYLGEVQSYYYKVTWWDVALHFSSALVFGMIGYVMIYIIFKRNNIRSSYLIASLFSFNFAVSVGVIWEIIEFCIDLIFKTNMQKSGLVDTMGDLIVDAAGAFLVSLSCYLYVRYNRRGIMTDIIKEFVESNPKILDSPKGH